MISETVELPIERLRGFPLRDEVKFLEQDWNMQ